MRRRWLQTMPAQGQRGPWLRHEARRSGQSAEARQGAAGAREALAMGQALGLAMAQLDETGRPVAANEAASDLLGAEHDPCAALALLLAAEPGSADALQERLAGGGCLLLPLADDRLMLRLLEGRDTQDVVLLQRIPGPVAAPARPADEALLALKTMADHAPVIIWRTDVDGRCVSLNRYWETFSGRRLEEGLGMRWHRYVHPEDLPGVTGAVRASVEARRPMELEYRLLSRRGWRWVLDTGAPHFDEKGLFTGYAGVVLDIDDRRRGMAELQESRKRFRDFAMTATDMLWETDLAGRITYLSERFEALTDLPMAEALGRTPWSLGLRPLAGDPAGRDAFRQRLARSASFRNVVFAWIDRTGQARYMNAGGTPIRGPGGTVTGYRGSASDVTARVQSAALLRHQATHDGLTGLPNRVALIEALESILAAARPGGPRPGLLCLDLDRFKDVNDTFGHMAGDELLCLVGRRLVRLVGQRGIVARIGGDEFSIVLHDASGADVLEALCRRVVELSVEPFHLDGLRVHVGISVGAALALDPPQPPEELFKRADIALYAAKRDGRETWRLHSPALGAGQRDRKKLEAHLRETLDRERLLVHYQPQVELASGRVVGVEALARWPLPDGGLISPQDFIPLAEETRLIVRLGEFVLRRACTAIAARPGLSLSVNLSPVQLMRADLVQMVEEALKKSGIEPGRLELELTESALLTDDQSVLATMTELKRLGVQLALDDFGTGFSSLSYLQRLPFDTIKLDRSFIGSLERDPGSMTIVRAVLGLGANLGMRVIAEGVETIAQARFLQDAGCRLGQGFLYAPGVPLEQLDRLAKERLGRQRAAQA